MGGTVNGKALVTKKVICWYSTFDINGNVVDKQSELYGENISGCILVFPSYKGSTVGSTWLYEMALKATAPLALICMQADPVTLSAAIMGNIPVIHKFDIDPTTVIETGDIVSVDGGRGRITITKPNQ